MIILTIRTDNPEAEIGLFDGQNQLAYETWHAHRELSATILKKVEYMLTAQKRTLTDVQGLVCFQGSGSFTGLRIGLTVANTLAYSLGLPIVATMGDDWVRAGLSRLESGDNDQIALPHYGSAPHITQQKK